MKTENIMNLITSECSWEQIIYKIIAWEGLDPWDLDIKALSDSFVKYITKMDQLDFKVPAKYVVIAAVLLRMKSDHLEFLEFLQDMDGPQEELDSEIEVSENSSLENEDEFQINPITIPPKRRPVRKIMVTELISALRKTLETSERRRVKTIRRKGQIELRDQNIVNRISHIYERIDQLLSKIKKSKNRQIKFSELVDNWNRKNIIDTFLPLVFLDNDKKVRCQQEKMFDDILISKS